MDFIDAMAADELGSGQMRRVELDEHEFLIARVGTEYYAIDERCPHMHAHLSKGTLEGTIVTCPLHHSQFDVRDGRVIRWTDLPEPIKKAASLLRHARPARAYEVRVEGGRVLVGPQKEPPPVEI